MKTSHILISLLLALLLIACSPAQLQSSQPTNTTGSSESGTKNDTLSWKLTFNRSGGLAGVNDQVTIYADGRLLDERDQAITANSQAASLVADISKMDFSKFEDDYGKSSRCNDCFSIKLSFEKGSSTKTINMVDDPSMEIPAELQALVQQITAILPVK